MTKLAAAAAAFLLGLAVLAVASSTASTGDYGAPSIGYEILVGGQVQVTGDGCEANIAFSYAVTTGLPGDPNGGDPVTSGGGTTDAGGAFSFILDLDAGGFTVRVTCGDLVQVLGINVPDGFGNTTTTTTSSNGGGTNGGGSNGGGSNGGGSNGGGANGGGSNGGGANGGGANGGGSNGGGSNNGGANTDGANFDGANFDAAYTDGGSVGESAQGPFPSTRTAAGTLARLGAVVVAVGAGAGYLARKRRARTTAL